MKLKLLRTGIIIVTKGLSCKKNRKLDFNMNNKHINPQINKIFNNDNQK